MWFPQMVKIYSIWALEPEPLRVYIGVACAERLWGKDVFHKSQWRTLRFHADAVASSAAAAGGCTARSRECRAIDAECEVKSRGVVF